MIILNTCLKHVGGGGGGGGGFFLLARIWGECSTCAFFFFFFFFFLGVGGWGLVEISSCTPIPLFMPPGSVHSGSAS